MTTSISVVSPRLDHKPWGGRTLTRLGIDVPEEGVIGEALITAGEAQIVNGFGEGGTVGNLLARHGRSMLGDRAAAAIRDRLLFPLLIKLIDASENLSIQVHPDDAGAVALDRLGKTEAWHILAAEPGAMLYLGLRPGVTIEEFRATSERADGSAASLLRRCPAEPGTTVLIPAGTVHALGAGVMVYEVQQPSDVTFRLDDWGRRDAQGHPREMHLEQGMNAIQPYLMPEIVAPVGIRSAVGQQHLLTACRYFALERIALHAGSRLTRPHGGSPQVVTVLEGSAVIGDGEASFPITPGASGIVWPTAGDVTLSATAPLVALRAWVPDLTADVVVAARASGSDAASISALAGPLDDLRGAMLVQSR